MFKFEFRGMDISHKYDEIPTVASDKEFNKHFHNFYEIFYFISGTATYTVENEKCILQPHDGLIIRPGEFHNVEFLDQSPYERYVLKLPIGFMLPYLEEKLKGRSAFFHKQEEALEIFQRLDKGINIYKDHDFYYFASCVVFESVLCFCNNDNSNAEDYNIANSKILPVIQYINDNIRTPLTLNQIADAFQYSPDYLSREFYHYIKTPIMKYVRTKRIFEAHRMLLAGYKPMEACQILGYSDYSTFYRTYVSALGVSPTEDVAKRSKTSFSRD